MSGNDLATLVLRTLVTTFVVRFVLDVVTGWVAYEARGAVVGCVLAGWCLAVLLAAYIVGSGIGAIAAAVACIWHVAGVMRERTLRPTERSAPRA